MGLAEKVTEQTSCEFNLVIYWIVHFGWLVGKPLISSIYLIYPILLLSAAILEIRDFLLLENKNIFLSLYVCIYVCNYMLAEL